MGKAIIRMQKLKSPVAVRRSMTHAFREQDTPNADPERTPDNTHLGAQNVSEAMQRFNEALPDKVRKNAVLAVEYLVTGSPEAMQGKSREEQDAYFADAIKWLEAKHGKENVLYAGIHRDETTPHLYAYVIPFDSRGRLNCRAFYGEKGSLSEMQTDFAEKVGAQHGLERGLQGSKARHTPIKQYYARVNAATQETAAIDLPDAKWTETNKAYGLRVAEAVIDQLTPELQTLRAKAQHTDLAEQKARVAEQGKAQAESRLVQEQEKSSSAAAQLEKLMQVVARGGKFLDDLQRELKERFSRSKPIDKDQER